MSACWILYHKLMILVKSCVLAIVSTNLELSLWCSMKNEPVGQWIKVLPFIFDRVQLTNFLAPRCHAFSAVTSDYSLWFSSRTNPLGTGSVYANQMGFLL
jgi:hypothetical protein